MNDRGMPETMFILLGHRDGMIDIACADERQERHHLFHTYERMVLVRFAEHQLGPRGNAGTRRIGQERSVLADEILAGGVVLVVAHLDDRAGGQLSDLVRVQLDGPSPTHRGKHRIEHRVDDEHFLLCDAQQVVVVGGSLNDAAGRVVQVCRFVDDHGRVARAGDDRSFATVERRAAHRWTSRDTDQSHVAMPEQRFGRFEGRLGDHRDQVVDPDFASDRFIEAANTFRGDSFPRRVRVDHHRVATREHADGIASDRRQAVCNRSDRADHTERGPLDDR